MMINKSTVGDVTVVAPEGSIDTDTSRILKEALNGLIDTGRTAVLVAFAKRLEEVDGKVALCSLSDDIQSVFDTVGFTQFFDINQSTKEALASLS